MTTLGKILVAVDFSKGSLHALEYAVQLCKKLQNQLIMVWIDNATSEESSLSGVGREIKSEVKRQFDEIIQKYKTEVPEVPLDYKIRKGKVYYEMGALAKAEDAGLIIAGSHGVSGFEQFWIGSNAYRIVSYAPCPVITLRQSYSIKNGINKIILPIDNTLETKYKVPFTAGLASFFNAEVHVLAMHTTSVNAVERIITHYAESAARMLQEANVKFVLKSMNTDNITYSTIEYAAEYGADLISIMTEKETASGNMHLGFFAQQIINNSPIPVLTTNVRESERTGK